MGQKRKEVMCMNRVWNLSAGPATLPLEVLEQIQVNFLDYEGTGMSVIEMSHRSSSFQSIIDEAELLLRELLDIPEDYAVLFMQGGATLQFSALPLNLSHGNNLGYIVSGSWGDKAYKEAKKLNNKTLLLGSSKNIQYTALPTYDADRIPSCDYVHITSNNTIEGTEYFNYPECGDTPLVADMSSDFLSQPVDVTKFGLIYAGVQKNLGPAGISIVIVKKQLIREDLVGVPTYLDYATHANNQSMYNTPNTFAIYASMLVLRWLKKNGGLQAIHEKNKEKAQLLYDYIDHSSFYHNPVKVSERSLMNIPFTIGDKELEAKFIKEAKDSGFENIKGHRSVGGMRASLYNAFPKEGVLALIRFMNQFEEENQS